MQFGTLTFALFVPLVFACHWAFRGRSARNAVLLVASYAFYAWWDYRFCGLMVGSTLVDYGLSLGIVRSKSLMVRRWLLAGSLLFNLSLLATFKYADFFIGSLRAALAGLGVDAQWGALDLVLPVGISFYTFQTLSYTIDVYRRKIEPTRNLLDYAVYVSFFPQLVAGPIERGAALLPQFTSERSFDSSSATDGLRRILWGLIKKLVIADRLSIVVDRVYADPSSFSGVEAGLATIFFAFQIYCDFSAYSDIAIGTARLFGVKLSRNFCFPYFSQSLVEFWRRWHISLSTWFRDYLYVPLGGSRRGRALLARNLIITFVVSGLWHGAAWTFVAWGLLHGLAVLPRSLSRRPALSVGDVPGGPSLFPPLAAIARMVGVFLAVCAGWVFFRAPSISDAIDVFQSILRIPLDGIWFARWTIYYPLGLVIIGGLVGLEWMTRKYDHPIVIEHWPRWARWALYTVLLWGGLYSVAPTQATFIYFQF